MLKSVALPQNASDDVEQFENLTAGSDGTTNLYYKYLGIVMKLKNLLTGTGTETVYRADDKFDMVVLERKDVS